MSEENELALEFKVAPTEQTVSAADKRDLRHFSAAIYEAMSAFYGVMERHGYKPMKGWGTVKVTDCYQRGVRTENGTAFGQRMDWKELFR